MMTTLAPPYWRFKGDVYKGLDADAMSEADLQWAQDNLRILIGTLWRFASTGPYAALSSRDGHQIE